MDQSTRWVRHPDSIGRAFLWALLLTILLILHAPIATYAQEVVTNITSTTGAGDLGTTVTQSGNLYDITGGTRPGNGPNLFHSFGDFSLGTVEGVPDIANFLNNTGLQTSNIISRVTGGNISNIYGTIQTTDFGSANLFLVNPSGFVFGPEGSLNVTGSVSFSTAQYLRLFDGINSANFYADPVNDVDVQANSVFAMAPVVNFGFLSPAAYGFLDAPNPLATIMVQGRALSVLPGQSISLVGGKVIIQGDTLPDGTVQQSAHLLAPNGTIHLASTTSPGEFDVATLGSLPNINGVSFTSFGSVSLLPGSSIDVSGANTVFVKNGQLVLSVNNATLSTSESPALQDTVSLNQGSSIVTSNSGAEPGADVQVTVGTLNLDGFGTAITTQIFGDGNGGNITANVGNLSMANGAVIQSQNFSVGTDLDGDGVVDVAGIGGDVIMQGLQGSGSSANSVSLDTFAAIKTETLFGLGRGGDVSITSDRVLLDNMSEVFTNTFLGNGAGGNLALNVGALMLNGGSAIRTAELTFGTDSDFDGVPDPGSTGSGGHVTIQGITGIVADSVLLSGGSQIKSESLGFGDGGRLFVAATSLTSDGASTLNSRTDGIGRGGDIVVNVEQASFSEGAAIVSRTAAVGAGGKITVQGLDGDGSKADALFLAGFPSRILSESEGSGRPGDIVLHAKTVSLTDRAAIEAGTTESNGTGGNVSLDADSVVIAGGSLISSQAFAQDAGQVTITADQLSLDNGSIVTATASVFGGRGGDVVLDVGAVSLANGATINSSTSGTGQAGDITMNVATLSLTNDAEISSNSVATASGDAGIVTIQGSGGPGTSATSVSLSNSSLLTNSGGTGAGGEIQIRAGQIQLADLALLTAETSGTGRAGSIAINSDNISITGGARIEASTQGIGNAGDITITNTDTVSVTGLSSNGSTRSGIFAKTQTSGGGGSGGSGSGGGGGGSSGGSSGGGSGGGGQTATPGDAGNIDITTNNLLLSGGAQIDSSTTTSGSGGSVLVTADAITITGASTSLKSDASRGNGIGGDITLVARTIGIHDKASVTAATDGSGDAGDISMTANESFTLDSAAIITTSTRGAGNGGKILINSPKVLVDGLGTSITASTLRPFADLAVTLNIVHPNVGDLTVRLDSPDGTRHALLSRVGGSGDNFTGTIFDDQATQPIPTTSSSAPFTGTFKPREPLAQLIDQNVAGPPWKLNVSDQVAGNAGTLVSWSLRVGDEVIQSTNVPQNIPDSGSVSSSLVVTVPAGTVVQGVGEVTGNGGDVTINAGTVTVQNGATLSATTRGSGQGGTVSVTATDQVALAGPGTGLFTNSEASGGSGDIKVEASRMTMNNGAKVSAASTGSGNAGSITANVGTLTLTNDAEISSSSFSTGPGAGDAGNVRITASGAFMSNASTITTSAENAKGGDILLDAQNVLLSNGTLISASSNAPLLPDGAGNAGNIKITSASDVVMQNSKVTTEASAASGGSIEINASDAGMIQLVNSQVSTSVGGLAGEPGASDGGNINIDPQFVILQNSQILAQAFAGAGGAINIIATSAFIADPASIVSASSTLGISGTVNIQSPLQNIGGELAALSEEFSSGAALLAQQCAARAADGKFSTFVISAREGLPAEPGGFLASPSLTAELLGSRLSGRDAQTQLSAVTGLFPKYDAKPIQLAKLGSACHR